MTDKSSLDTPQSFDPSGFVLSDEAIQHFSRSLNNMSSAKGIRFAISEASGCSGYTYELDYVIETSEDDLVFNFENITVFIDPNSFKYLKGTTVDFEVDGVNQGVKFLNPNVKAVCGCGESFEVEL